MYKFYERRNFAETWRDPDIIDISNEQYFETFEKAREYILKLVDEKWFPRSFSKEDREKYCSYDIKELHKLRDSLEKEQDEWGFQRMGSWQPCYCLEKIEVQ